MTITPDTKLRSHKINILRSMSKYLILLLIPLVHTLIDQRNDLPSVLEGQFFDWLLVGLILAVGVYAWVVFFFFIDEDGITVQQGILLRRKSFFPFARVTAISVEHPWYFRPFRIAYLTVDTNGGDAKRTDFAIWIHARRAEAVLRHYHEITGGSGGEQNRKKKPKALGMQRKHIVFFSLITSSSLTGVLYVYAILKQSANYLGEEYPQRVVDRFADLAKLGSFNAPPLVAFVAYALLLCWAVSFVFTLLRYLRFRIQRELKQLDIRIGLLSPRKISIMVEKIKFVFLRQ